MAAAQKPRRLLPAEDARQAAVRQRFLESLSELTIDLGRDGVAALCVTIIDILRQAPAPLAAAKRAVRRRKPDSSPNGQADVLGLLTFLRGSLIVSEAQLTIEERAAFVLLVDLALRDLHPAPLPPWLGIYQTIDEVRREAIDDFVAAQGRSAKSASEGTH